MNWRFTPSFNFIAFSIISSSSASERASKRDRGRERLYVQLQVSKQVSKQTATTAQKVREKKQSKIRREKKTSFIAYGQADNFCFRQQTKTKTIYYRLCFGFCFICFHAFDFHCNMFQCCSVYALCWEVEQWIRSHCILKRTHIFHRIQ